MGSASADKVRKREGHRKARLPAAPSSAPAPCKRRAATKPAAGGKVGAASSSVGKLRTQSDAQAATARSSSSAAAEPILFSTGSGPEVYTGPGAKLSADAAAEAAAAAALLEQLRADNAALNYQLQAAVSQLEAVGREQRTQVEAVGSAVHPALGRKQRTQLEMMKNSLAQAALDREQRTQLEVVRNSVAYAGVGREQHMPLEAMSREQHMQQLGMERPRAAMQEEAGAQTEISAMNAPFDQRHIHGQRATAAHKGVWLSEGCVLWWTHVDEVLHSPHILAEEEEPVEVQVERLNVFVCASMGVGVGVGVHVCMCASARAQVWFCNFRVQRHGQLHLGTPLQPLCGWLSLCWEGTCYKPKVEGLVWISWRSLVATVCAGFWNATHDPERMSVEFQIIDASRHRALKTLPVRLQCDHL
eukprot:scaffold38593_cov17-Tisochrysis_lutea.AAC.1